MVFSVLCGSKKSTNLILLPLLIKLFNFRLFKNVKLFKLIANYTLYLSRYELYFILIYDN